MIRILSTAVLLAALGLGGCGRQAPLKRVQGMKPLPAATGESRPATAEELIQPSIQSRPIRNGDALTRSQERLDDPFDKPPGADNGR